MEQVVPDTVDHLQKPGRICLVCFAVCLLNQPEFSSYISLLRRRSVEHGA
jgi:hypothetical protein